MPQVQCDSSGASFFSSLLQSTVSSVSCDGQHGHCQVKKEGKAGTQFTPSSSGLALLAALQNGDHCHTAKTRHDKVLLLLLLLLVRCSRKKRKEERKEERKVGTNAVLRERERE